MMKSNFIVITGGPGSGKSTILDSLAGLGYRIIGETARIIIRERVGRGLTPRPDPGEFAQQIFEIDLDNYLSNINTDQPVFFDRSFLDSAAMLSETGKTGMRRVTETVNSYRFRKNVFIAPPWKEIFCNDNERDQTFEDSVEIYKKLYSWYQLNDYVLTQIPCSDIESRVNFILQNIK